MSPALTRLFVLATVASFLYLGLGQLGLLAFILVALWAVREVLRRWPGTGTTHGTAAFATEAEVAAAGMTRPAGIHLGRLVPPERPTRQQAVADVFTAPLGRSAEVLANYQRAFRNEVPDVRLRLPPVPHAALFGASGGGKGTAVVVPTLLTHRGPVVVFDPKGENYLFTAAARRAMGRTVHRIDPYHAIADRGGAAINPLGWIDPASQFVPDQAKDLASALVVRTGQEKETFFNDTAERFIQSIIAATIWAAPAHDRHLGTVSELIANPAVFANTLQAMQSSADYGGVLRTLAQQVAALEGREKASVLSTVAQHLGFLNSQGVREAVRTTSFDPLKLKTEGHHDLFLILPPERLKSAAGFSRYLLTSIVRRLAQGPPDESREVLLVLDECATLGALPVLEELVCLLRGWGVRTLTVWQSVGQLQDSFPGDKSKTFQANMGATVFAKTNDLETAKLVSEMIGDTTVLATNTQSGGSHSRPTNDAGGRGSGQRSESWSTSHSETRRRLLQPEEVLRLPARYMVAFTDRSPPVLAEQVRYYEPQFRRPPGRPSPLRQLNRVAFALVGLVCIAGALGVACQQRPPAGPAPELESRPGYLVPVPKSWPRAEPPTGAYPFPLPARSDSHEHEDRFRPGPGNVHAGFGGAPGG